MQGTIKIESTPGVGSCFCCTIPFKVGNPDDVITSQHEQQRRIANLPRIQVNPTQPPHILLIEDNQIAQKISKSILEKNSCIVTVADCLESAKLKLNDPAHSFDLLIVDMGLPDGSGLEILTIIENTATIQNHTPPIIGLTAHMTHENIQSAIQKGFNTILVKPLTPQDCSTIFHKPQLAIS